MKLVRRLADRINGTVVPAGFDGELGAGERVLASSIVDGRAVVATSWGLWVPSDETQRLIPWHLISKARWEDPALEIIEVQVAESTDIADLLTEQQPFSLRLTEPGRVPEMVNRRVQASIAAKHHRELPSGGAWFVQRRVAGQDGIRLQVRPDPGTDVGEAWALTEKILSRR